VAQLGEAVYVLHAFQKKSTSGIATPQRELDLIRQRLQLARKLDEPSTTSDAALAQNAARRLGFPQNELRATLEEASLASKVSKLDPKKALDIVQTLLRFGRQLSGQRPPQEKNA